MKVKVVRDEELSKEFHVLIDEDDIGSHLDDVLKKESANITLAGFRKGKAPFGLVKKKYGAQFEQNVRIQMLEDTISDVVKEHNLSRDKIDIQFNASQKYGFDFTITYDINSAFELQDLSQLKIINYSLDEDSEDIQNYFMKRDVAAARIQTKEPQEGPIEKNHCAVVTCSVYFDDNRKMEVFNERNLVVYMDNDEYLGKDFIKALMGMKKDETKKFEATFPKKQPSKKLAGQKLTVEVTVNEVYPMSNLTEEEFTQKNKKEGQDAEAFKKELAMKFRAMVNEEYIQPVHKRETLDALDEAYDFALSSQLLAKEEKYIKDQYTKEKSLAEQKNIVLEEEMTKTPKEIEAEFSRLAKRRLKIQDIFNKISEVYPNETKVTDWEFKMKALEYARTYPDGMDAFIENLSKNQNLHKSVYRSAHEEKLLTFIRKSATLEEKPIKEFTEILKIYDEVLPGVIVSI